MHQAAKARTLLGLNTAYFALAAMATVYVVSESWHQGFWRSPMPLLLTLTALSYIGATFLGLTALANGRAKWLFFLSFIGLVAVCAAHGAYMSPVCTLGKIVTVLCCIVTLQIMGLMKHLRISGLSLSPSRSALWASVVRTTAMVLPVPIMAFAMFQLYVRQSSTAALVKNGAMHAYMNCEGTIFGHKRVHKICKLYHLPEDD